MDEVGFLAGQEELIIAWLEGLVLLVDKAGAEKNMWDS